MAKSISTTVVFKTADPALSTWFEMNVKKILVAALTKLSNELEPYSIKVIPELCDEGTKNETS